MLTGYGGAACSREVTCAGSAASSSAARRRIDWRSSAASGVDCPPRITARNAHDDSPPIAPVIALTPAEQAALVALAARVPTLTTERLDELAALAAPVSGDAGRSGPEVTRRVLGVAQWVLGRR